MHGCLKVFKGMKSLAIIMKIKIYLFLYCSLAHRRAYDGKEDLGTSEGKYLRNKFHEWIKNIMFTYRKSEREIYYYIISSENSLGSSLNITE